MLFNCYIVVSWTWSFFSNEAELITIADTYRLEFLCFWKLRRVLAWAWHICRMILSFFSPRYGVEWGRCFILNIVSSYSYAISGLIYLSVRMRDCDSVALVPLFGFWRVCGWAWTYVQLKIRFLLFFYRKCWGLWQY